MKRFFHSIKLKVRKQRETIGDSREKVGKII